MDQMKKEELEITISDSDRIENAIRHIQTAVDIDPWAVEIAVEAMKAQLSVEGTTPKVKKTCITCKHYPPESKWPCIDCDMRNPADRWEPQELSKNSTELDKENGELHPTCTGSCTGSEELKQEAKNSKELSSTQKALDTVSRQAAIEAVLDAIYYDEYWKEQVERAINELPSAQHEIIHCKDCKHFGVDRYKKLTWCSRINYGYGYQADDFCSKAERRTDGRD